MLNLYVTNHFYRHCIVEANINADGNQQEDLANCVAEVSNNIFSPGHKLLVIFPIAEQTQRMGEFDTCWRPVDNEYVRNTHRDLKNETTPFMHYIENYCYTPPYYKFITQVEKVHDDILTKLHSLNKWPILLNPAFDVNEYHYDDIGSYIIILNFKNSDRNHVLHQLHEAKLYIEQNNLEISGKFVYIIAGEIITDKYLRILTLAADTFEQTRVIIAPTKNSEKTKILVKVYDTKPYVENWYGLETSWI